MTSHEPLVRPAWCRSMGVVFWLVSIDRSVDPYVSIDRLIRTYRSIDRSVRIDRSIHRSVVDVSTGPMRHRSTPRCRIDPSHRPPIDRPPIDRPLDRSIDRSITRTSRSIGPCLSRRPIDRRPIPTDDGRDRARGASHGGETRRRRASARTSPRARDGDRRGVSSGSRRAG